MSDEPKMLYGVEAVPDAGPTREECARKFDDKGTARFRATPSEVVPVVFEPPKGRASDAAQLGVEGCRCGCSDGRRVR